MDQINIFLNNTMKSFDQLMLNPYFATILTIILTVYASLASHKLPNFLKKLFDNTLFKIIIISFIAYRANKNPQLSILIAVCFVITLNFLAEKETKETFEQIERFNQLEYFSNALDVEGDINPETESKPETKYKPEQKEDSIDDDNCNYSKI
jgi:chromate transport protein ChrA